MIKPDGSVRRTGRELREAHRGLSEQARRIAAILERYEQHGFFDPVGLCGVLDRGMVSFVAFSCLGTCRKKQELLLDLDATYFFRSSRIAPVAVELCRALEDAGVTVSVDVFLPDLEPRQTWGWSVEQEEITVACELMRDSAVGRIPQNWRIRLWSEVEADCRESEPFTLWVTWAEHTQPLLVHHEAEHLREFPDIEFAEGVRAAAVHQVAAYAREGWVLERVYPGVILLQSEAPYERKDRLYQPRRGTPLPIVHPFRI